MDHKLSHDIKGSFVELNLRKRKWLPFGLYHLPSQSNEHLFNQVKKVLICKKNFMKDIC